jgi:hypothetical protein
MVTTSTTTTTTTTTKTTNTPVSADRFQPSQTRCLRFHWLRLLMMTMKMTLALLWLV